MLVRVYWLMSFSKVYYNHQFLAAEKKIIVLKSTDTSKVSEKLLSFQDDAGNVTSAWCPCNRESRDTPMTQQAAGRLLECDAL